MSSLRVVRDPETLSRVAAEVFLTFGAEAIRDRGRFTVALSGGTTPRATYERIAETWRRGPEGPLDWARVHLFWGDERTVPIDDPRSNYHMVNEAMLEHVPIPSENVHDVPAALPDPREAANVYEARLVEFFHTGEGEAPRFDLILLGLGPEGHVASLFPGTEALEETERLVAANWVESHQTWRITLTLPVLNAAAHLMVLVAGAEKAEALARVLRGPHVPPLLPAERLAPTAGTLVWLADRKAAEARD
jgi:6-phosphogluconolactonase